MGTPDPTRAMYFAQTRHAGQLYNEEVPYTVHLDNAVSVAARFGFDKDAAFMCAVRLHDIIEDTRTKYSELNTRFGEDVAELVFAVTDELGRNRKERHDKTYPKLKKAGARAIALKLVDRIANVEYGLADKTGKAGMYAEEFPEFVKALYDIDQDEVNGQLWRFLARLMNRVSVLEAEYERQRDIR